ncbi:hypothetical protein MMC11_001777 [Xylographa trunciseda]|nr:hypothetical protein [Xylographa trunciseda]
MTHSSNTGFYVLDPLKAEQLILGPFHGKVACQTIAFHKGVCGAAAATGTAQLVPDVEAFPGHIACDGDSKSEIVVPVKVDGKVITLVEMNIGRVRTERRGRGERGIAIREGLNWLEHG